MNAVRRLRELQLQLQVQDTSMREYSGDPNYLGQKVNGAMSRGLSLARAESLDRVGEVICRQSTQELNLLRFVQPRTPRWFPSA